MLLGRAEEAERSSRPGLNVKLKSLVFLVSACCYSNSFSAHWDLDAKYKSFPTHDEAKTWLGNYDAPILLSPSPSPVKAAPQPILGLSAEPSGSRFSPYHSAKPAKVKEPSTSPVQYQERFSAKPNIASSSFANLSSVNYSISASSSPVASSSKVLVEDEIAEQSNFINLDFAEEAIPAEPVIELNAQQTGVLKMVSTC